MTPAKRDARMTKPKKRLTPEQRPVERRFKERRQRDEPVAVERRFHARRKSYEIPLDQQLRRLPQAAKVALQVQEMLEGGADLVGAVMKPHERFRTQKGELITYKDGIYLRYY